MQSESTSATLTDRPFRPRAGGRLGAWRAAALAFALALPATAAVAQTGPPPPAVTYEPSVGQPGKDVVWVPTPQVLVNRMLDMAKVTPSDYVIDLGSGDGRLVITAVQRGARALGVEYNPDMIEVSRRAAVQAGVGDKARFVKADLFETDFSEATVITMFLLPAINLKLRPKLLELRPGTRIVSNSFDMGEWKADETASIDRSGGCETHWCNALLWIVPAQVGGTHKLRQGELQLEQTFQMLTGTLRSNGSSVPVTGKVVGNEVTIDAGGRELRGTASGRQVSWR
jgi:hypothetical protein